MYVGHVTTCVQGIGLKRVQGIGLLHSSREAPRIGTVDIPMTSAHEHGVKVQACTRTRIAITFERNESEPRAHFLFAKGGGPARPLSAAGRRAGHVLAISTRYIARVNVLVGYARLAPWWRAFRGR